MALVTLNETKLHLNIPESETQYDTELATFIAAATPIIEHLVGPVDIRTITSETYDVRGRKSIILRTVPVVTITSVKEYIGIQEYVLTDQPPGASSVSLYGYTLKNASSGLITRRANGFDMRFLGAEIVVSYTAGRASVPADVKLAALDDIRALWSQTQVASRPQFGGGGVVMGPDRWGSMQELHMFPRLALLIQSQKFMPGVV